MTSFQVVAQIKKKFNLKKVGHAGTLDPLASGVLVILTGDDTKKQDEVMKQPKEYIVDITFGISSPSHDLEFLPTFTNEVSLPSILPAIDKTILKYRGEIIQEIPAFSAKKVAGKPLYKNARKNSQNITVKGDSLDSGSDSNHFKQVIVNEIVLIDKFTSDITTIEGVKHLPTLRLKINSSHGFFVRSLARDLGRDFNTSAVVTELVRSKVGEYSIETAVLPDSLHI